MYFGSFIVNKPLGTFSLFSSSMPNAEFSIRKKIIKGKNSDGIKDFKQVNDVILLIFNTYLLLTEVALNSYMRA